MELKVVSLKDALNHEGKAVVVDAELRRMHDLADFAQDFSFICKKEGEGAKLLSIKEAFNYRGKGNVKAISPDMSETMTLEEFQEGFFFLILNDDEDEEQPKKSKRGTTKLDEDEEERRKRISEEGEEEVDFIFDDDN